MSFISYAQNFEDVMLWRALKHIEIGFYIDVGANHPIQDSVTKAFYDYGWRGINIEPVSQWFEKLVSDRPRDINLQVAAGSQAGEIILYELPDTGLSTADLSIAERHELERGYKKIENKVPVKTLTEICEDIHLSPIHFVKIDVEGSEKQVLEGIDFSIIRPWIILVESTLPNSQIEDYVGWEPILLNANYEFVYFDGLNRFYVAQEHAEFKASFKTPPNYFDDFVLSDTVYFCNIVLSQREWVKHELLIVKAQLDEANQTLKGQEEKLSEQQTCIENLQSELGIASIKIEELNQSSHHWWTVADGLSNELQGVYRSKSWRITLPLRLVMKYLKLILSQPKRLAKYGLRCVIRFVLRRPILKSRALRFINRKPELKTRLQRIEQGEESTRNLKVENINHVDLTNRASRIYRDLSIAMEKRREKEGD